MAVSKTNATMLEMPAPANRTMAHVLASFRDAGAATEKSATTMIDGLRIIVESSAPVNGKGTPAMTDVKQCYEAYDAFQNARAEKSVGKYVAVTGDARKKQVEKFIVGFNFATGKHKADAVRVMNDTYMLLLGDADTGEGGLGGRVYSGALSVLRKHNALDKAMSKSEIKAFLQPAEEAEVFVYNILKRFDDTMNRELGNVAKSKPTIELPGDAKRTLNAMRAILTEPLAKYKKLMDTAKLATKSAAEEAARKASLKK